MLTTKFNMEMNVIENKKATILLLLVSLIIPFVSAVGFVDSDLKINELVSNPLSGSDWVEIYYGYGVNGIDLSQCKLADNSTNELSLSGTINPGEFLAFNWSNRLNNGGDTVFLKCNGQTIDEVMYGTGTGDASIPISGESIGRCLDGEDTDNYFDDFKILNSTKGFANDCGGQFTGPVCGDGFIETGEQCDDGNLVNGDGCSNICEEEPEESPTLGNGNGIGVDIGTEDFVPLVWMDPNSRVILDDNTEPGRISNPGRRLVERINNYAFEGEQIQWEVLVMDKNGINKVKDVYATVGDVQGSGNDIEVNCQVNSRFNNYYDAMFLSADRLVSLQADITEDNAGNGNPDIDPDDGGWDWITTTSVTEHSASQSPTNLVGVTGLGLLGAFMINSTPEYMTSIDDAYTFIKNDPYADSIDSCPDVTFLVKASEITGDSKYAQLAKDVYDVRIIQTKTGDYNSDGTANGKDLAERIRDLRGPSSDGIIPWDIGLCIEGASALDSYFPGQGYDSDAKDMAEVIFDDFMGAPGYFNLTDNNEWWYSLGLTGVLKSFRLTGLHQDEYYQALDLLLNAQNSDGGLQWNGVWPVPGDLQSTAYSAIELFKAGQRQAAYKALDYVVLRQLPNGAFEDEWSPGQEIPEIDGESATAIWGQVANALASTLLNANVDDFGSFNPKVMAWYKCTLTVETPESMYGKYWITVEAEDLDGLLGTMDENEYWFLNPTVALSITGDLAFSDVRPGTSSYSDTLLIGNDADPSSGVLLDMFISGTDFYDSASSGAVCPTTNQLSLSAFSYYATNGGYSTLTDGRNDAEGYVPIAYGIGFNDPNPFYGTNEILQSGPSLGGAYSGSNVLTPGSEIPLTFRLNLPEPCNGDFNTGSIYFWGEAI